METNKVLPIEIRPEKNSKGLVSALIYAGKLTLVDFGGKFPNGNDVDPNLAVAAIIIGASAINLARQII